MKYLARACFVFTCIFSIIDQPRAQPVLPLAVVDATWILFHHDAFWGLDTYYALKVNGDTLLNSTSYKRVYRFALSRTPDGEYYQTSEPDLVALMRDDTMAAKVYAVFVGPVGDIDSCTESQSEVILYDFTLAVGEPVTDCRTAGLMDQIVIDSIYEIERYDAERRIWAAGNVDVLIEGVGYDEGLFTEGSGIISDDRFTTLVDYCIGSNFECGLFTSTFFPAETESLGGLSQPGA